jgi:cytochrome b561
MRGMMASERETHFEREPMNSSLRARYDTTSMLLHWLAAVAVVASFVLGPGDFGRLVDSGRDPGTRADIVAHESIGIIVFLLTAARLIWTAVRPAPPASVGSGWQLAVARVVRVSLWVLLLATPATALLTLAGEGQPLTLLGDMRLQVIPVLSQWPLAKQFDWGEIHTTLGDAIIWLAGLHAAAALVHHFFWHDHVLKSMLPRRIR